jgi:DNA-binding transcriptional LysR family regulator
MQRDVTASDRQDRQRDQAGGRDAKKEAGECQAPLEERDRLTGVADCSEGDGRSKRLVERGERRSCSRKNRLAWDSQQVPGLKRQIEGYCKKYGKFRPRFHGSAHSLARAFELIANENVVYILPDFASHYSPPGVVILPLADAEVTWKILVIWRRGRTHSRSAAGRRNPEQSAFWRQQSLSL